MFSFDTFILEKYGKYGSFEGSIKYNNWSDFKNKLLVAINNGFSSEEELIKMVGMDYDKYNKIRENMIYNWKDSVSKSLLHSIAQIGQKIPKEGDNIFRDLKQQTMFLILASTGEQSRNIFGNLNSTQGLGMLSRFTDFERIKNKNPNITTYDSYTGKNVPKKFIEFGTVPAYTVKPTAVDKLNELLQYVWLYAFYHHYRIKKDKPKLPKFLYRGIRTSNLKGKELDDIRKNADEKSKELAEMRHEMYIKYFIDGLIDYITKKGISKISDGKLLSFTESRDIAAYFANKEGIILRVDPNKVEIVTSPKTEEFFREEDYVSGKKEKEYIIKIPVNYKFSTDDIEIVHGDYWEGANSPLAVQFFDHDNRKAIYELDGIRIEAQYVWRSNTSGGIVFRNLSADRDWWGHSRRDFKKTFDIDPMPTEENLSRVKDFKIIPVKSI